jgi:acetyltransferase-like isoleucine patch superfamily enzyme
MTPLSAVLAYFPTLILLLSAASFVYLCTHPGIGAALLLFILYGLPMLTYRLHQWRYPVQAGISYLQTDTYSPWWGSHQIQAIYIAFPILETVLRLIPGMFSLWLRLWGAKVGRQVYWTPKLDIADRGLVEIGDRVVFGYGVGIYSHIIKPRRQDLMLYVKPVKIGSDVFLGAGSHFAPGVVIADGTYLPVATHLYPNQTATPDSV